LKGKLYDVGESIHNKTNNNASSDDINYDNINIFSIFGSNNDSNIEIPPDYNKKDNNKKDNNKKNNNNEDNKENKENKEEKKDNNKNNISNKDNEKNSKYSCIFHMDLKVSYLFLLSFCLFLLMKLNKNNSNFNQTKHNKKNIR
jgi:hypothetical protein